MNIKVEKQPKSEVKLTITLGIEEQNKYYEKAVKELSNMVKVPGFRPGHIPAEILKKHVKEGAIEAHMIDSAIPETYTEAIKKEKIPAISRPKVKILQESPLQYEAIVAVYPEVELSGYDKFKIDKKEVKVTDKDVEETLKEIQKRHAKYKEVDRKAKKGDRVEINFEGFDEGGAKLESTASKNHPLVLGDGTMVKGFEEELEGLKKGDDKEFTITFPKDYFHKPFQNKKVKFKVHVNKVEEIELPKFTKDFIKQVTGKEVELEEVKKDIKEGLKQEREQQEKSRRENEFLNKLAEKVKVEIPEILIEEELDAMIEEFKHELAHQGIKFEQYLEATKETVEKLKEKRKKEAEKRLKLRFALQELFKKEKIEVDDNEIKEEIKKIKMLYPENERLKVDVIYAKGGQGRSQLENKIKIEKLFSKFLG